MQKRPTTIWVNMASIQCTGFMLYTVLGLLWQLWQLEVNISWG